MTLGHLTNPARLKEILQEHVAYADEMQRKAAKDAKWAGADPSWAYARVALQWAERYYANERELALKMIKDLDEAEAAFPRAGDGGRRRFLCLHRNTGTRSKRRPTPTSPTDYVAAASLRGDVAVHQTLRDRRARARIRRAERIGGGVADRVQAVDGTAVFAQHPWRGRRLAGPRTCRDR